LPKEILKNQIKTEVTENSGILGLLMVLSLKATINLLNWDGVLMKNKFQIMLYSIDKDAKLLFI
jgi:hypothetical protein